MNAAIIVCSTLTNHVKAAQKKMNTNYPIIELDNSKHSRPEKFWQLAFLAMEQLPEEIDTVLLGLGVCGGASVGWTFPRRTINTGSPLLTAGWIFQNPAQTSRFTAII